MKPLLRILELLRQAIHVACIIFLLLIAVVPNLFSRPDLVSSIVFAWQNPSCVTWEGVQINYPFGTFFVRLPGRITFSEFGKEAHERLWLVRADASDYPGRLQTVLRKQVTILGREAQATTSLESLTDNVETRYDIPGLSVAVVHTGFDPAPFSEVLKGIRFPEDINGR
jgi:hypothetical protein